MVTNDFKYVYLAAPRLSSRKEIKTFYMQKEEKK